MLLDTEFQQYPSGQHIGGPVANVPHPGDGPGIGPAAPTVPYAPVVLPNQAFYSSIQSQADGKSFPTVMSYFNRPLLNPAGSKLILDFDLYVNSGIAQANATEFDTMLVTSGAPSVFSGASTQKNVRRNCSMQSVNGQLYLIQKGVWVKIPGAVCVYQPGLRNHHTITYGFGATGGTYENIEINGKNYSIPTGLACDVELDNWAPGAVMQLQQSLIPTGSRFDVILEHAQYSWPI